MTPEERKARNRLWRALQATCERWEDAVGMSSMACARELRALLLVEAPRKPGRPRSKGWVGT